MSAARSLKGLVQALRELQQGARALKAENMELRALLDQSRD
jgi:hypothetical protein